MAFRPSHSMDPADADNPGPPVDKQQLWLRIGIHRPIASFWYQFVLLLVALLPALLVVGYLIPNVLLPYPSAVGFYSLTTTYFQLFFSIMDLATGPAVERFVAEHAELRPRKALHYIQFFIWFQMFTGLVQVTGITVFCMTVVVHTNLSYAAWFFLLFSTTQFPGMLATYSYTLKGFQRYDKDNIVVIVQGVFFEAVTQVVFILLGRWWGMQDPAIGEVFGATLGYIIGRYLDDFVAMALAAYFVSQVVKPFGISLRETIVPAFTRDEVKECLAFGVKLILAPLLSYLTDFLVLIMMVEWMPNYVAILGLVQIAKTIADAVGLGYNFKGLLSEAYNNGKKRLTQYTITTYIKYWWFFAFFLTLEVIFLIPPVLGQFGGNYAAAAAIIPLYVFPRLLVRPPVMGNEILQACDKPELRTIGLATEKVVKMVTFFLLISPWGLTRVIGTGYMLTLYILHDIPAYVAITVVEFTYIHKRVAPLRVNFWQTFVAGTLASLPLVPVNLLVIRGFDAVVAVTDSAVLPLVYIATALVVGLFVFPIVIFYFYGFFGGWDDRGLEHFRDAVPLCGPSKAFVRVFYAATAAGHRHSPWRNKHPIPHAAADRELEELQGERYLAEGAVPEEQ